MLRGLLVGMLGGGLVMAALLAVLSLLAPLPRVNAPVAEDRGRPVPLATAPQRSAVPEQPSNIVEQQSAPSGSARVETPRPTLPVPSDRQTALLDAPRPAEVTTRPTPAPPVTERAEAPLSGTAPLVSAPTAVPPVRDSGVALAPSASTVPTATAPSRRITGDATDVTAAPEAMFDRIAPETLSNALPAAIVAVAPTPKPERPARPRSELRVLPTTLEAGPIPPRTMLVRGPDAAPEGQARVIPQPPVANPFAGSPLGGSDFASSLAGSRLLEGTILEGRMEAPVEAAPEDQVAAAPQPAPEVPSQSRDAPMVGAPVLPLTERTGVRPLTERRPTLPLTTAAPAPGTSLVPAWQRNAVSMGRPTAPILSVMVIDDGVPQRERRLFVNRALPVTVVVDLDELSAASAIADYRAAGFEVMLLPGEDLTAEDALAAHPEAIGLLMPSLSPRRVEALKRDGHAVVLRPGGLDGGLREFQQSGLPGLRIYRDIDAGRERAPVIARYLTRAGFEAARSNGEVILGRIRADTLDALAAYIASDASLSVPIAPVSMLMTLEVARLAGEG